MNFRERVIKGIIKIKDKIILGFILWIVLSVIFVAPFSIGWKDALKDSEIFQLDQFIYGAAGNIMHPIKAMQIVFSAQYLDVYLAFLLRFSIIYIIGVTIGLVRAAPKHAYEDIENGSSDWCVGGEQYRVLSKKERYYIS